jgi:hypothetical protein
VIAIVVKKNMEMFMGPARASTAIAKKKKVW